MSILRIVVVLDVILLSVVMLSAIYADCHNYVHYAACRYAECHCAACRYAECCSASAVALSLTERQVDKKCCAEKL